ncbi:hypothetical protein D3C83_62400 [compost metagenome]
MKGAAGFLRRSRRLTSVTGKVRRPCMSSRMRCAAASFGISAFLPSIWWSLAGNCWPFFSSIASIDQYSTGLNARISRSRSTISRSATVCTRPAERPFFTVFQRSGLAL